MTNYYLIETIESNYTSGREDENPLGIIGGVIIIGIILTLLGGKTGFLVAVGLLAIALAYVLRDFIKIGILIKIGMVGYNMGGWIGGIVAFVIAACIMEELGVL